MVILNTTFRNVRILSVGIKIRKERRKEGIVGRIGNEPKFEDKKCEEDILKDEKGNNNSLLYPSTTVNGRLAKNNFLYQSKYSYCG